MHTSPSAKPSTSVLWPAALVFALVASLLGFVVAHFGPVIGGVIVIALCSIIWGWVYLSSHLPVVSLSRIKFVALVVLVAILPFENTLNLLIGFSLKPLVLIPFVICVDALLHILASGKSARPKLLNVAAVVLMLWAICYIPVTLLLPVPPLHALTGSLLGFFIQFRALIYYFALLSLALDAQQTKRMFWIVLGTLFILVSYGVYEFLFERYGLVNFVLAHSKHAAISEYGLDRSLYYQQYSSGSYRSMSFSLEFVAFGYAGFVLASIVSALVCLAPHWRKKAYFWSLPLISVLGLLSSQTVSAIGSFLVSCLLIWIMWKQKIKMYYSMLLLILALVVLLLAIAYFPEVVGRLSDILTGRDIQADWHHAYNAQFFRAEFSKYVFLGYGTGVAGPTEAKYFRGYGVEHEYFGNAIQWGWPGLLLYVIFMISLIRHTYRIRHLFPAGSVRYALSVGLFVVAVGYSLIGFYHNVWGQSSVDVCFLVLLAMLTSGNWSRVEPTSQPGT
jgi:hypothetical protein